LGLTSSAARAFQAIAAGGEAGWAEEARQRAAVLERDGRGVRESWENAMRLGTALITSGAAVPADVVQRYPGLMRAYFYNAARTAPSRERVLALEPMAAELDRFEGQSILVDYIRRLASADFRKRAPLASAYQQVLDGKPITPELATTLATPTGSSDVLDIVMGGMVQLADVADHLDGFERMTRQTADAW